jgi:uncharacterized membrane protein HdeD (DUF308 family)
MIMKKKFKNRWLVLIKGIILILLGFYVFRHPVDALVGLALYVGISLLITGIFLVIAALSFRKKLDTWSWRLAEGIIDIVFALVLLSNPAVTAAVFPFVVGFWIIVYGVIFIADAVRDKEEGAGDWWMGLVGGIAGVIIGYFVTSNPIAGAISVTFWIGLAFLLLGIVNVAASFRMKKINSVGNQ